VFHNTLSARPLFVDHAGGVTVKLDAGDLAVALANDLLRQASRIRYSKWKSCPHSLAGIAIGFGTSASKPDPVLAENVSS
jgi:ammonia channel protein AmtB